MGPLSVQASPIRAARETIESGLLSIALPTELSGGDQTIQSRTRTGDTLIIEVSAIYTTRDPGRRCPDQASPARDMGVKVEAGIYWGKSPSRCKRSIRSLRHPWPKQTMPNPPEAQARTARKRRLLNVSVLPLDDRGRCLSAMTRTGFEPAFLAPDAMKQKPAPSRSMPAREGAISGLVRVTRSMKPISAPRAGRPTRAY